MKTNVTWIIGIHQVDYLWGKSQANVCLKGAWKLGTFNFLTLCSTVTTWKGPRKCHGRVMEKSLNYILGFLYEPCICLSVCIILVLTHPLLDKMAAILADDILKCIFLNENDRIPIQISLKFVPRSLIDNKAALVEIMAWRQTGAKPLPEPVMTAISSQRALLFSVATWGFDGMLSTGY